MQDRIDVSVLSERASKICFFATHTKQDTSRIRIHAIGLVGLDCIFCYFNRIGECGVCSFAIYSAKSLVLVHNTYQISRRISQPNPTAIDVHAIGARRFMYYSSTIYDQQIAPRISMRESIATYVWLHYPPLLDPVRVFADSAVAVQTRMLHVEEPTSAWSI